MRGDPDSPYGLRRIGEPPTISSTPPIAAAIGRLPARPDDMVGL